MSLIVLIVPQIDEATRPAYGGSFIGYDKQPVQW
jgi:hypothetical protein